MSLEHRCTSWSLGPVSGCDLFHGGDYICANGDPTGEVLHSLFSVGCVDGEVGVECVGPLFFRYLGPSVLCVVCGLGLGAWWSCDGEVYAVVVSPGENYGMVVFQSIAG